MQMDTVDATTLSLKHIAREKRELSLVKSRAENVTLTTIFCIFPS